MPSHAHQSSRSPATTIIRGIGVCVIILAVAWLTVSLTLGGVQPCLAWSRGEAIYVSPRVHEIEVDAGTTTIIQFQVRKLIFQPVSVVGATPGCGCVSINCLPLELADSPQPIEVSFTASESKVGQIVEQNIPLHLNVDSAPAFLSIKAQIRNPR
ncbi:MAG: hypothetical protein WCJ09_12795 [Planctomycetota bacterium]